MFEANVRFDCSNFRFDCSNVRFDYSNVRFEFSRPWYYRSQPYRLTKLRALYVVLQQVRLRALHKDFHVYSSNTAHVTPHSSYVATAPGAW